MLMSVKDVMRYEFPEIPGMKERVATGKYPHLAKVFNIQIDKTNGDK